MTPPSSRARLRRWTIGQLVADATLCALGITFALAFAVAAQHRNELVGAWEIQRSLRHLVLIGWLVALPASLVGAMWLRLCVAPIHVVNRVIATALATASTAVFAWSISTGRHFDAPLIRASFIVLFSTASSFGVWFAIPTLGRWQVDKPLLFSLGTLLSIFVLKAVDWLVLPHLYSGFHLALNALVFFVSPWLATSWREPLHLPNSTSAAKVGRWVAASLPLFSLLLVPSTSQVLARSENVRFVYGVHDDWFRLVLQVAERFSPAREDDLLVEWQHAASINSAPHVAPSTNWRGRTLLLITVDALRADHVGSYGYTRKITPAIDALAEHGVQFQNAVCATPHTSYSVTSLMTGKFMRPLIKQGAGQQSETIASLLRTYGYRTAAFYPPAVFFIDEEKFADFKQSYLDFEYRRVEFSSAQERVTQLKKYLDKAPTEKPLLLWVHLFEPHEPYVSHPEFDVGPSDLDRYDSEIAYADAAIGELVSVVRARDPKSVVMLTSDHGEEFGEHGGRFHGSSVFDEQVRVPLIVNAVGLNKRVVTQAVQSVDIMPTILASLGIPKPARVRGDDVSSLLVDGANASNAARYGYAEGEDSALLLKDSTRLVCHRPTRSCQLFDTANDPLERQDLSASQPELLQQMRAKLKQIDSTHGDIERSGLRQDGKSWPEALRRGMNGDRESAADVAALLEDSDRTFRRKAAQVLFELRVPETAPALRLSLTREDDDEVKRWAVLTLTRLGEGALRSIDMLADPDVQWRRLAALALAESGDSRGETLLIEWWQSGALERQYERAKDVLQALGRIRSKQAILSLTRSLHDIRLRSYIASSLADIGDASAKLPLLRAFETERYLPQREALASALIRLGAQQELAPALIRFLGVPDPMPNGLRYASKGHFLGSIGGPDNDDARRLRSARSGSVSMDISIPRGSEGAARGVKVVVLGHSVKPNACSLRVGQPTPESLASSWHGSAELDQTRSVEVSLPPSNEPVQVAVVVPESVGLGPGRPARIVVSGLVDCRLEAVVIVPIANEIPPPAPEPWTAPPEVDETP